MDMFMNAVLSPDFVFVVIRVTTPILFAALACMVFKKGGIDAIGIEGIMLMCAMAGSIGSYFTKSAFGGVLIAVICGISIAFLFGYVTLQLKSMPILAGIAINILAGGLTIFIIYYVAGEKGSTQSLLSPGVPNVNIPILHDIPVLGRMLSGHNILTYVGILMIFVLAFLFYKTPLGLRIRSIGENPQAASTVGLKIMKYKYITLAIAGTLSGLGGAFMSLGYVSFFSRDMIAGRGWIGMAAEAMGRGNPIGVALSSALFGLADSIAMRLQIFDVPAQFVQTFPYIITIVAISVYSMNKSKRLRKNGGAL